MEVIERIVIVGGGYAGVLAANRLVGRVPRGTEIRLVNAGPRFVNRIRLHEAAARGTDVEVPLRALLHADVVLDDAKLVGLDPAAHTLFVERDGARTSLTYAHTILAMGSVLHAASGDPACDAVSGPAAAKRFHARLCALPSGARVAVVGGGLTAIELATEIAEARPDLHTVLVAHHLLPDASDEARRALSDALTALAIEVVVGQRAEVRDAARIVLDDGRVLEVALCGVCDGFRPADAARVLGLPSADDGRVRVDATLRVEGCADLFAVGDLAAPPAGAIGSGVATTRMGCATAMPMGAHAADEIVRAMRGRRAEPYRFAYALRCISLGRRRGLVLALDQDDRPRGRYFSGAIGAMIKEVICRFVIGMMKLEARVPGAYAWPRGRRPALLSEPTRPLLPR